MKKNIKIILPIMVVIILSVVVFIFINNRNKQLESNESKPETKTFYIDNKDKNNDGIPDTDKIEKDENGIIKKESNILYNPNETSYFPSDIALTDLIIPNKENIDVDELTNYLKWIINEIGTNSYTDFNKNNIDNLMLVTSFPYSRTDKETIKKLAKIYFDVDDYTFPIGTYHTNNFGDIDIIEVDDFYVSKFNHKFVCPCLKYQEYHFDGNELVVQYDYLDYGEYNNLEYITYETPHKTLGTSYVYLEYNGDNLNLKKVEYKPN